MKKLLGFISYFLRAEKCWYWPRLSDVLIYDACNQDVLLEYLHPWRPEVLHVRGEQINVRVLITSLFRGGKKSNAYVDCFIERVHPRLIVTFIDNSLSFLKISQRHPEIKTLFIQNGLRGYYADIFETLDKMGAGQLSGLKVDYMLLLGSVIGAEYARYITGAVVPMGSIKNNLVHKTQLLQRDVIAFASQWNKDGFYMGNIFYTQEEFFGRADRPIVQCLAHYAKSKKKRLVIIPRNTKHGDLRAQEEAYFRELLGDDECIFIEPQGLYPSYQALDAAEVVVAVDSTLGYESIARGKKTAIFSIRSNLLGIQGLTYGWPSDFPVEGPFWTNYLDIDAFVRILDYLFEVDDVQWRKDVEATNFSSIMIYNPGNSILQSIFEKELGSMPVPRH
jgi:surface carbohydrate biosynthesis protein